MQGLMQAMGRGRGGAQPDMPLNDTAETIYISSLALLKMLKHGRAGVPMEVMGEFLLKELPPPSFHAVLTRVPRNALGRFC
jgi:hypothetical protein